MGYNFYLLISLLPTFIPSLPSPHLSLSSLISLQIKSMPITVFSFTLLGSMVKVCEPSMFSGPFISYIREVSKEMERERECILE